jgi:hypothetical protein
VPQPQAYPNSLNLISSFEQAHLPLNAQPPRQSLPPKITQKDQHQEDLSRQIMENRAQYLNQQKPTVYDHVLEKEFIDRMRESNYLLAKEVDTNRNHMANLKNTVASQSYKLSEFSVGTDLMSHQQKSLMKEMELVKRENEI